ncbi:MULTISPECIES: hypothetical protein [Pseudarthrobacter]|uniref:hypothetical protein n=1 Tax=Pseudarthrobacter TaxID=1742993 RepID=UPI0013DA3141|nr:MULTISPECIES: hypothetical protein [Pseudarthrobacter]MDQ0000093.1 hypothetical protein [Pseudarthrobacter sulfonivorans]
MSVPIPEDPERPSLGVGLRLEVGDLMLDAGARDLATVRGADTLAQALEGAVETQLGSDRLNVGFGFDRLAIGAFAHGVDSRRVYVKMQLVRTMSADRRVRDVRDVVFEDEARFAALAGVDAQTAQRIADAARRSREHMVHVVLETVAGDVLDLPLGGTGV